MSVLIKGMEMPTSCLNCRFHKSIYCTLTDICTNTAQGCPLVPVPPHGRLIDADALINDLIFPTTAFERGFRELMNDTHTIIPADTAEEGK